MAQEKSRTISRIGKVLSSGESKGFAFEAVAFPARQWADGDYGQRYHVFRTPDDQVTVQAESAVAAIKESGVKRPYMIVRGQAASDNRVGLIRKGRLTKVEASAPSGAESKDG